MRERWKRLALLAVLTGLASFPLAAKAIDKAKNYTPDEMRAVCATRAVKLAQDNGRGMSGANQPNEGIIYWRCPKKVVLICNAGNDGSGCSRHHPIDDVTLRDLAKDCSHERRNLVLSNHQTWRVSSEWECIHEHLTFLRFRDVDGEGYIKDRWAPLPK